MTKQEIDILNFENQLMIQRQKLNDLIYLSTNPNENSSQMIEEKIVHLEQDILYMENQVKQLKTNLRIQNQQIQQPIQTEQKEIKRDVNNIRQFQPEMSAVYEKRQRTTFNKNQPHRNFKQEKERKETNIENLFGKKLMGIFASVLIFIGMILFATIIVPYLTDELKVILMYAASAAILATGVCFMRKNHNNWFFISLAGLGVGCLYISIILTNTYFGLITEIPTYVLLFGWGIGTIFLSKMETELKGNTAFSIFQIIGRLGILISVILGCILTSESEDGIMFLMITIYNLIALCAFEFVKYRDVEDNYHIENQVLQFIGIISMIITLNNLYPNYYDHKVSLTPYGFSSLLIILITIAVEVLIGHKKVNKNVEISKGTHIVYSLFYTGYLLTILATLTPMITSNKIMAIIGCIIALLFVMLLEYLHENPLIGVLPLLLVTMTLLYSADIGLIGTVALIVIPCYIYGQYCALKEYAYIALGVSGIWFMTLFFSYDEYYMYGIATVLMIGIYFYIREKADINTKMIGYIITILASMVGFARCFDEIQYLLTNREVNNAVEFLTEVNLNYLTFIIPFIITSVIHIITTKKLGFETKDEKIMGRVITAILMCMGWSAILMNDWQIVTILVTLCLFVLNSRELLETAKNRNLAATYITIKYTIYMLIVLSAFDAANFVISIMLLLFALASIVIGFINKEKGFRVYGLTLSMISIFKLVMVDAWTGDAITGAISFMLCGGLCFAISFIYNKIQNWMDREENALNNDEKKQNVE